ncbi:MAG TPA: thermonuclease family protein [Pirellulales bacterium]
MLLLFPLLGARRAELPESLRGNVVSVYDGDTLLLRSGTVLYKIRLEGIDAPERGQDFGTRAKKALSDRVIGKPVMIVTHGYDRYGRVLGTVLVGSGKSVNRELVEGGWAWHYTAYSKDEGLATADAAARAAKLGLWQGKDPVPPWEWRKTERGRRVANAKNLAPPMKSVRRNDGRRVRGSPPAKSAASHLKAARPPPKKKSKQNGTTKATSAHWLNTESGVRHNASCRWFKKTTQGKLCEPGEGKACKICGG